MAEQMMQETAGKAIPAGYKQTEVGVIPEDWEVAPIGSVLSMALLPKSARPEWNFW